MDRTETIGSLLITGGTAIWAFAYGQLFALICMVMVIGLIMAIKLFEIVTRYWQIRLRRMGRDLARYKNYGPHWFFGVVTGVTIMVGTTLAAYRLIVKYVNIDDIIELNGGLIPLFWITLLLVFGLSFGWALTSIHMRVANHLDRKAGRRPTFTI